MVLSLELQHRSVRREERVFFPREYRGPINEQGISLEQMVPFGLLYSVADCSACIRRCTTTEAAQHVDRVALGEVAISGEAPILELLTSENHALLTGWHPILILDLSLDVPNRVSRLDLDGDRPTHEGPYEDL
jgi:hypothetical protein